MRDSGILHRLRRDPIRLAERIDRAVMDGIDTVFSFFLRDKPYARPVWFVVDVLKLVGGIPFRIVLLTAVVVCNAIGNALGLLTGLLLTFAGAVGALVFSGRPFEAHTADHNSTPARIAFSALQYLGSLLPPEVASEDLGDYFERAHQHLNRQRHWRFAFCVFCAIAATSRNALILALRRQTRPAGKQ